LRAVDCHSREDCIRGDRGRLTDKTQQRALAAKPRPPEARRARPIRHGRGSPRPQAKAVDFADHGVAGDADFGGDLAAGQPGADKAFELVDALRCPSPFDSRGWHELPPYTLRPDWAAELSEGFEQQALSRAAGVLQARMPMLADAQAPSITKAASAPK